MGIGDRLREERERLGLNQTDFAARAGASKNTQYNYEKGERSPDANYLAAAAQQGVDVLFVITGTRNAKLDDAISEEGLELLQLLPKIRESDRAILIRTATAFARSHE